MPQINLLMHIARYLPIIYRIWEFIFIEGANFFAAMIKQDVFIHEIYTS